MEGPIGPEGPTGMPGGQVCALSPFIVPVHPTVGEFLGTLPHRYQISKRTLLAFVEGLFKP